MILSEGQLISNRYEIIKKIGEGGMSVVYLANDIKLDRHVSFKALKDDIADDEEGREDYERRLLGEARAVAKLNHPNIVSVYDVGQDGDIAYIVAEYVDGATLKDSIIAYAPFGDEQITDVARQIAAALSHAHKNNIVHRDVKPQNVLLTSDGNVIVTDFGIARLALNAESSATVNETTIGSVHYIAPEQAKGGMVDARSDLYSLGIVMFEMATGRVPFDSDKSVNVALAHIHDPLPDIRDVNPDISIALESIIIKLTSKEKNDRYRSADELTRDLTVALERPNLWLDSAERGSELSKGLPPSRRSGDESDEAPPEKRKNDMIIIAAAVATGLLLIVGIIFISYPWLRSLIVSSPAKTEAPPVYPKVPNLIGMSLDDATELCGELGLLIEVARRDETAEYEPNTILQQNYVANEDIALGTVIGVVISVAEEKYVVPDFVRDTIDNVYANERQSPFALDVKEEYSDSAGRGVIMRQSPEAGTLYPAGTKITLYVSLGKETSARATVPDIRGKTLEEARRILEDAGFTLGQIVDETSETIELGKVITQAVLPNQEVLTGTPIGVVISSGKPLATVEPTTSPTTAPTRRPDSPTPTPSPTLKPSDPDATPEPETTPEPGATESPTEDPRETEEPTPTPEPIYTTRIITVVNTIDPANAVNGEIQVSIVRRSDSGDTEIYTAHISLASFPLRIELNDTGRVLFDVYLNGIRSDSVYIDFND